MIKKSKIVKIEQLEDFDNEYVYDIAVKGDHHYFFGNNILLHNTDSVMFSAAPIVENNPDFGDFDWSKENIIQLYDAVGEQVNDTFPNFMKAHFNVPENRGQVIRAGREIVGSKGLFIRKKRYAIMMFEKDGHRLDVEGKPGKIKAMGLDTKRTDTPKTVQDFLEEVLTRVLTGQSESQVLSYIKTFREDFRKWDPWLKGTPKGCNGLTDYAEKAEKAKGKKVNMPGHIRAALNWNLLRKVNSDNYSLEINDGYKLVVCKLKHNPLRMTSIAYPVDELHLPGWFKELPFDDNAMEQTILDQKLQNLIGILKWDLSKTREDTTFGALFKTKN